MAKEMKYRVEIADREQALIAYDYVVKSGKYSPPCPSCGNRAYGETSHYAGTKKTCVAIAALLNEMHEEDPRDA